MRKETPQFKKWPQPEDTGEVYLLYPKHTTPDRTEDAMILSCAGTLDEARQDAKLFGGAAIYVCDFHVRPQSEGGDYADNERFVEIAHD